MKAIYLNKEQADEVRGEYKMGKILEPRPTENNMFVLPVGVIKDPNCREALIYIGDCRYANIEEAGQIIVVKNYTEETIRNLPDQWEGIAHLITVDTPAEIKTEEQPPEEKPGFFTRAKEFILRFVSKIIKQLK